MTGEPATEAELVTVRLLGLRHLGQGVAVFARPAAPWALGAPLVDALHAVSMGALVRLSPRYRRVAASSAVSSTICAAGGAVAMRTGRA